ncbi:sigma-70 family RNA polymerase sigma factor [Paraconexibacter antarcticus]|uniref:Sigma-70 family RNA polymerase sigma factor n=1 Tax=Paraconexibacter antarcticus TaxID=2949664 RepID=A0ABY5DX97_9ACTN|nr:sigma-70 family RNA polymerase sigma factor [Paraconexibacter antarcticus]UTI66130.1 sigma-70 family RNA polymerase sigma factor [Paraconexibacter antarcticus]
MLNPDRSPSPLREAAADAEYRGHRDAVLTTLRLGFPPSLDREDILHQAWLELLQRRARGEKIENTRALLREIAVSRAYDARRRPPPEPVDPADAVFTSAEDDASSVAHQAQTHLDADALRSVIDSLEPREAAVLKMRFELQLTGPEIQKRLGVSSYVYEQLVTRAYKAVREQVLPDASGETPWQRRQRSLLLVCEMGIASSAQIEQARLMVQRDPRCRAMLRSMRAALRDVAAALPLPPGVEEVEHKRRPFGFIADWADRAVAAARDVFPGGGPARPSAGPLVEQASGGLAGALGLGGAAKVVAACIALGGTAAVCIHEVLPTDVGKPDRSVPPHHVARPRVMPVVASTTSQPVTGSQVRPTHAQVMARAAVRHKETPVSSPAATAAPSPVPAGTTEFGPGTSGSAPNTPIPAAAPANGGGEFAP